MIWTRLTASMPTDTSPKSVGERSRARTARAPMVTTPCTTAPDESQNHPLKARSVRLGEGCWGAGRGVPSAGSLSLNSTNRCLCR